ACAHLCIDVADLSCKNSFATHSSRKRKCRLSKLLLAPRSHRRRYSIPADSPRATLQRSIGLLNRDDEDFCTRLEIALVPRHVNNNRRIGGDKKIFFSLPLFFPPPLSRHPPAHPP